jgi:hypothetical protein
VSRSVEEIPVSESLVSLRAVGTAGGVGSIVRVRGSEALDTLPAASVACAVRRKIPAARGVVVMDQAPFMSAVAMPRDVTKSGPYSSTTLRASAMPVMVGVKRLVSRSVEIRPVSEVEVRLRPIGESGGVLSEKLNVSTA